ncbi:MAG: M13 family metallopeptidase, partial [Shewanella sp.]|nr:M13 family metallopeptidase [Shewanella sp.]
MKKSVLSALGLCAIASLSACSDNKVSEANQVTEAVAATLNSGVEFDNFDRTVRPQDDFYTYVNGAWLKAADIPADRTSIGAFYDLREKSREDVKAIIEEVAAKKDLAEGSDEQKVADLYRSYMDVETLNKLGVIPLETELKKIAAIENKAQLAKYFAHSQIVGGGTPMAFYIGVDAKNSSRYATHIWQYGLSLPEKDYYFNQDERFVNIRKAYVEHIEKMFTLAGFDNPKQAAQTVMALETAIAEHHWDVVETRDSTKRYNKYELADLKTLAPNFNWDGYLKVLGGDKQPDIIINQPSFIKGLTGLVDT